MTEKEVIHTDAAPPIRQGRAQAIRYGNLVFLSGQVPRDAHDHYVTGAIQDQARQTFENLRVILEAAGSSLANVVRVLQFHTDIAEFYPVYKVWERCLGGRPLPFSAIEVPAPLPVPGATVMIEAWAYAP